MFFFRSCNSFFGDRVFHVLNGERRHVVDISVLQDYGLSWPVHIHEVDENILFSLRNAGWLPKLFPSSVEGVEGIQTVLGMRDYFSRYLNGIGIEFGAGSNPFPTRPGTHVIYADKYLTDELATVHYSVADLVHVDLASDVTEPFIPDGFADFIVLCHVIEHLRNPILCLKNLYAKLKPGGVLLLVVPDKMKTFDKNRKLTDLAHIVDDFASLSDRCVEHYFDFYSNVHGLKGADLQLKASSEYATKGDIHFHTFTYESFGTLISYVIKDIAEFSEVISVPTLIQDSNEFYYLLRR